MDDIQLMSSNQARSHQVAIAYRRPQVPPQKSPLLQPLDTPPLTLSCHSGGLKINRANVRFATRLRLILCCLACGNLKVE